MLNHRSVLCPGAVLLVVSMSVSLSGQHSGGLTRDERAIVQHIDASTADAAALLMYRLLRQERH